MIIKRLLELVVFLLGMYLSLWVLLIGGIIQAVNGINPFMATNIIIGIVKIVFCGVPVCLSLIGIGMAEKY